MPRLINARNIYGVYGLHIFRLPAGLKSSIPPEPSDRISSATWLDSVTHPSFPPLYSLSPPRVLPLRSLPTSLRLPAFVSPFQCIRLRQDLCMFRPVTIDSRDAISGQGNGTENFQSLNVKFLGPKALSLFISAMETGIIIVLFARFFVRRKERLAIQVLVYFVTFMSLYVAF